MTKMKEKNKMLGEKTIKYGKYSKSSNTGFDTIEKKTRKIKIFEISRERKCFHPMLMVVHYFF